MANVTTSEADRLLDASLPGGAVYLALVSSVPDKDVAGAELAGNGYARQAIPMAAAAAEAKTNSADIVFPIATVADWANIVGYEVWDAAAGGNRRWFQPLAVADQRVVRVNDQYRVFAGNLDFALS